MRCRDLIGKKVLFAGNGFNCLNCNYTSWKDLLKKLLTIYGIKYDDIAKEIPARFVNELILGSENPPNSFDILKEVNKILIYEKIEPSVLHKLAVNSKYTEIITTNYDYLFEKAAYEGVKKGDRAMRPKTSEKVRSLYRVAEINNPKNCKVEKICHPHGAITQQDGILNYTIWNDLYLNNYTKIRQTIFNSEYANLENAENDIVNKRLSAFIKACYTEESSENDELKKDSWVYRFYFSDIDFIGYSLDFEEIDIWTLLTSRADFIRRYKIQKNKINKIRFFMLAPKDDEKDKTAEAKKLLLEKLFVDVVEIPRNAELDYNSVAYYHQCFKR